MSQITDFSYEDQALKAYLADGIGILRIQADSFMTISDLAESGRFLALFHAAEVNSQINGLLVVSRPHGFSVDEYEEFICQAGNPQDQSGDVTHLKTRIIRHINILNRVVVQLADFKKIVAIGLQQEVVTPFFGASLAADFRFASEDMAFCPAHCRHGLHPTGALPFFLPRYVGQGKAAEILFSGRELTAQRAFDLGLVTQVLPAKDFEQHCLTALRSLCGLPQEVILSSKLLLNHANRVALKRYFDTETALLH